jgi:hypothetical protein
MDRAQVKIYAKTDSRRLKYIAGIILGDILGISWEIVTDKRRLGKHPVINYSRDNLSGAFRILPHELTFETGIRAREIAVSEWKSLPVFFTSGNGSDFPFDIFAASFFLVSRYEEYLGHEPDEHGRFRASSSLGYRHGFLDTPVVDLWVRELARSLLKKYPTLVFRRHEFRSLLTIDSDQPFAFLGKTMLVTVSGMIRDLAKNTGNAGERIKVVTREKKDPFEVFDYILENLAKNGTSARFFFPTGDHSRYDKNPSWKSTEYRQLICRIGDKHPVGIHTSYYSADKPSLIRNEITRLKRVTGREVTSGRFHYIRLFIPGSLEILSGAGITEDYSMGYPDEPGFRAGIARPFPFYNIREERQTDLTLIPFQVMDATLYQYKNMDPGASGEMLMKLIDVTRRVGGLFVSLWHNTTLLDTPRWKEWRALFELILKIQQS